MDYTTIARFKEATCRCIIKEIMNMESSKIRTSCCVIEEYTIANSTPKDGCIKQ